MNVSVLTTSLPATSIDLLTYDDYKTFPDNDGIRKEIIEGELYMTPAPSLKHQTILGKLHIVIHNFVDNKNLGKIFLAPCDVVFSNINVMQPDLIFIAKKSYLILTDLNIQGAPDLLIEILSPSTKENDQIYKKQVYEKFGVKEYWIIDPVGESVEIWSLINKKYNLVEHANKEQTITSHLLKELKIELTQVFSD